MYPQSSLFCLETSEPLIRKTYMSTTCSPVVLSMKAGPMHRLMKLQPNICYPQLEPLYLQDKFRELMADGLDGQSIEVDEDALEAAEACVESNTQDGFRCPVYLYRVLHTDKLRDRL